jgi:hypothetical protein
MHHAISRTMFEIRPGGIKSELNIKVISPGHVAMYDTPDISPRRHLSFISHHERSAIGQCSIMDITRAFAVDAR